MSDPKAPETPKSGYEKLGDHDPIEHSHDYVDGDCDDYSKGERYPDRTDDGNGREVPV